MKLIMAFLIGEAAGILFILFFYDNKKSGKWILKNGDVGGFYKCSACGFEVMMPMDYCPCCGARMVKKHE